MSNYYQFKWNELHQLMVNNVKLINDSHKCLKQLDNISNKQLESNQNFNLTLKSLNEIENGLEELDQDLNNVQKSIRIVEKLLKNYEKKKELESLKKLEIDGQIDYQNGCRARLDEFENYKYKLLDDHQKKAKEIEKLQFIKFKQKSNAYQNNFEKQLEEFKRTGQLNNLKNSNGQPVDTDKKNQNKSLEEIDIETDDQDLKALDDFLND